MYSSCHWDIAAGLDRLVYLGIAGTEIESVARMLGIPPTADVLDGVRAMAATARPILNEKT